MPRILIVDDEPEMVRGLEDNLRFEGYQTLAATNGKEGLALALREAPDLVVLDIMMPELSGWDVLRGLRQRGGDVPVHLRARQAFKGGKEVKLTRREFDLIRYLMEHPGEVLTRDRLLDEVWGYEAFPTTRTVDTHILRLRQKFETDPEHPKYILTVHGQGYKFAIPVPP